MATDPASGRGRVETTAAQAHAIAQEERHFLVVGITGSGRATPFRLLLQDALPLFGSPDIAVKILLDQAGIVGDIPSINHHEHRTRI